MCMGCGSQDHEGRSQYARNSGNSPQMMILPKEYVSRNHSQDRNY